MRSSISVLLALVLDLTTAVPHWREPGRPGWDLREFKSLVTFGDSYTDENRLDYWASHNGNPPPTGWVEPMSFSTPGGGITWPRWVSIYTNATLYNYAVSGAVCSNALTPRTYSTIHAPFPDIAGYELPAFNADAAFISASSHQHFLSVPPPSTVYAMWIGTNDLGANAFLTDSQVAGKTIADYIDCVYAAFDGIYATGGRYFVLMNVAPLQLAPLYATPADGGLAKSKYWSDKPANITEVSYRMLETVVSVNEIFAVRTPFELLIKQRYPRAKFAVFDANGLMTDIWNHPSAYLNGTAPANVTGFVNHCDLDGSNCVRESSPDSFMWFDELHPSQQADRVIAKAFVDVVKGESKWATYWAS